MKQKRRMEESIKGNMKGNGTMVEKMVKEQKLTLVEESMKGNGRIINLGREHYTTKTKTSLEEL